MRLAKKQKKNVAKSLVQTKREPFFSSEGKGIFFSKPNESKTSFFNQNKISAKKSTSQPNTKKHTSTSLQNRLNSSKGKGRPLSSGIQSSMGEAFTADFSDVRIHTDKKAAQMNEELGAKAFTYGNHIYFNEGKYDANSTSGKHLLAHELTHTLQQNKEEKIQRAIGSRTRCPSNVSNAPNDPISLIKRANDRAITLALGTSNTLFLESILIGDSNNTLSLDAHDAYLRRFGAPTTIRTRRGTKFKNRFTNSIHDTALLAQSSEMLYLAGRFERIGHFLERGLHFRCTGTSRTVIGNCTHRCGANDVLASCSSGHGNSMAICPDFWNQSNDRRAVGMIHEVLHMVNHYGDHDRAPFAQTFRQRRREPECYASLAADNFGITPFDGSCPIV